MKISEFFIRFIYVDDSVVEALEMDPLCWIKYIGVSVGYKGLLDKVEIYIYFFSKGFIERMTGGMTLTPLYSIGKKKINKKLPSTFV